MATTRRPLTRIITCLQESARRVNLSPPVLVRHLSSTCLETPTKEEPPVLGASVWPGGRGGSGGAAASARSCVLGAAAVALGLGAAAALYTSVQDERGEDTSPRTGSLRKAVLHYLIPSASCASVYTDDSPRYKYNFIADAVEKSAPAVVYIEIVGR